MNTVLLLEDDPAIASTVEYALARTGYEVSTVSLVRDAQAALQRSTFAAAILDIGLPDGNGLTLCKSLRAQPATAHLPILILSAQDEAIDKVLGLELGADDYLAKPFNPRELVARINALLRRSYASAALSPSAIAQGISIDAGGYRAYLNGAALDLTRLEFALLVELHGAQGRIRSRDQLYLAAWGKHMEGDGRSLDTHIKTLRGKLAALDCQEWVLTHRSIGYALRMA